MTLKTLLCFALLVFGSTALTCWRGTEKSARPMHHASFCSTVFSGKEGVFYGGYGATPGKHPDTEGMTTNRYCDVEGGKGGEPVYTCFCFNDLCNTPMKFNDFFDLHFGKGHI